MHMSRKRKGPEAGRQWVLGGQPENAMNERVRVVHSEK
jgi:hypothetical protein